MSKGVLCFANNNGEINYVKQAVLLANQISKHLDLPTTVVTSTPDAINSNYRKVFDNVITINDLDNNFKRYRNGQESHKTLHFKNFGRSNSYKLTPYEETLVLDTDIIICNNTLKYAFDTSHEFQIYKECTDLAPWRKHKEFDYINDKGIPFYWASIFYFKNTPEVKTFFTILNYVVDNWEHYQYVYDLGSRNFRNDHAFSIAIHIMNGFKDLDWAKTLPGKLYYSLDRDILSKMQNEQLTFLLEKENIHGEYTLASTNNMNVHVMNKFSLDRLINV